MEKTDENALLINRKEISIGDVCFFIDKYYHHPVYGNSEWKVKFGTVEEHYPGVVAIQLYEPKDTRVITDFSPRSFGKVPIKEFTTPTDWRKLPKNWSYDTRLWEEEKEPYPREDYDMKTRGGILSAISDGVFVKVQENEHCTIEAEIDTRKGYRLVKKYKTVRSHTSENFMEVYSTYEEAQKVADAHNERLAEIAAMEDLEWSIFRIDCVLDKWAKIYCITDDEKQKTRDFLIGLNNVEDVEVRIANEGIEWRYWKNKRWCGVNR